MGLNVSHNCWRGAYSAFTRWRTAVIRAAGIPTRTVDHGRDIADIDWGAFTENNLLGQWSVDPDDILMVLIVHADHEGWIMPNHARPLADRLEGLLPKLRETGSQYEGGHLTSVEGATLQFILGLRNAAEEREPVRFS